MIRPCADGITAFETLELVFELPDKRPWTDRVTCTFERPDGSSLNVPLFWTEGRTWKARVMAEMPGPCRLSVPGCPAVEWAVEAAPDNDDLPVRRHGPVRLSDDGRHFAYADGTPFFLLADSWWHGTSARLTEEEFDQLVSDRRQQGFNAIQLCAGFACDMPPYDPRDANEAGHPWTPDYERINPAFYDAAERRIFYLIEQGLVPMLVGMWGYHMHFMGLERAQAHWRHFLARYGALPVILELCGEATLPWYLLENAGEAGQQQTERWTEVMRAVREGNIFRRPLTTHPGPPLWFNDAPYPPLTDMSLADFHLGMGGHGGMGEMAELLDLLNAMDRLRAAHGKPVLIGEGLWEYMNAGCGPKTQRAMFWHAVLRGAPGHCYGADALWQMNSRAQPFGPSPLGFTWGNEPWEDAMEWPGSRHVAAGKRILEPFEWWRMQPRPEWLSQTDLEHRSPLASAAELPEGRRIYYFTAMPTRRLHLCALTPGAEYKATFYNPMNAEACPMEKPVVAGDQGQAAPPFPPVNQDWVLVLAPPRHP